MKGLEGKKEGNVCWQGMDSLWDQLIRAADEIIKKKYEN